MYKRKPKSGVYNNNEYPYYEPTIAGHYKKITKGEQGWEIVAVIKGKMPTHPVPKKMMRGLSGLPSVF